MERYTLITGASEGIGLEFARLYAKQGKNLILISRSYEKLSKVRAELSNDNIKIMIFSADLSVDNSCANIMEFVDGEHITVDRLINNAGIGAFGPFDTYSKEMNKDIIDINVRSLTGLTHIFLKRMLVQGGGEILNVASTAAFSSGPNMSIYYATKAFVLSLTEALNEEYKNQNIKVSCLCPGAVATNFQEKAKIKKKNSSQKLLMDAKTVAEIGVEGLQRGKAIIIPGVLNKVLVMINKFIPRSLSRKIVLDINS